MIVLGSLGNIQRVTMRQDVFPLTMLDSHSYIQRMMADELMAEWDRNAGLARMPGPLHVQFIIEAQDSTYYRGGAILVTGPVFTWMDVE